MTIPPTGFTASTTSPNPKSSRQTTITACRERSTARTNFTWLSSRSGRTPNTAPIRSYAWSGRCGRSTHELEISGWEKARNHDCLFLTAVDASVCSATTENLRGSHLNRPNWLPFKSALTPPGVSPPRLHDLRHSFAVATLLRWYRQGIDPNCRLMHLSTFLGHVDPSSTAVYLTITEELLHQAAQRFQVLAPKGGVR